MTLHQTADIELPPPGSTVFQLGSQQVVVVRPARQTGWARLGEQALEILYGLEYGRLLGAPVAILAPRTVANPALLDIECDDVDVLRSPHRLTVLRALAAASTAAAGARDMAGTARFAARRDLREYMRTHPGINPATRRKLKDVAQGLAPDARGKVAAYLPRRLVAPRLGTRLAPKAERRAVELAAAAGIDPDEPIVTVHVRERGWKLGQDTQDHGGRRGTRYGRPDDTVRNAWIETHFDAIDMLVGRGYKVVRLGDPTMTRVDRPGVVDLASRDESGLLGLHCLFRSRVLLCGESGPLSVSYLTNTPVVTVNGTDAIGAYPIRDDGILMMKTVVDRESGERLSLDGFLSDDYLTYRGCPGRYRYVQSTAGEIVAAVEEMLELLETRAPETPAQGIARDWITQRAEAMSHLHRVAKYAPDRGFLGAGRVVRSQADSLVASEQGQTRAGVQ